MRIDKAGSATPSGGGTRARRLQPGFAVNLDDDGTAAAASPAPAQAAPAAPVLLSAMAEAPASDPAENQKAAEHASALLQAMSGLQRAMLAPVQDDARQSLLELAGAMPGAPDPGLDKVLQEIAQRAAVELAKPFRQETK